MESVSGPAIRMQSVTKDFTTVEGATYTAVQDVSLEVAEGRFVSVVGPSGCGKSTLLNIAAGLMQPSAGRVSVCGEALQGLNRKAAYIFQQDALLPWKTVLENVTLGLRFRGLRRGEAGQRGREWIKRVGLETFTNAFPSQLSGGMRKRAALAQSWIVDPDILLLDEPFSALDVHTRQRMGSELLGLWSGSHKTVLFVTHDLEEALALSDEILILSAGPASRVVNSYTVDLERPRDLLNLRTEPRFLELYKQIWSDLKQQVLKSYERG